VSTQNIAVDGSVNLRDLGGYRTAAGHTVKRGQLLRSGCLAYLSESGLEAFRQLGVALICDLRRAEEREEEPTPLPHGAPHRLEIPIDPGSAVALRERMGLASLNLQERVEFMTAVTAELIRDHAEDYARMFRGLLDMPAEGAFLVHCSAGKDRTGVACALILHALGVPEETVITDYLLTNEAMDFEGYVLPRLATRMEGQQLPPKEWIMALAGVREEYLRAAYGEIHASFDDVEHYIEDAVGLNAAARAELQRRYLQC
jgi:protein-tyrosine phosphatase